MVSSSCVRVAEPAPAHEPPDELPEIAMFPTLQRYVETRFRDGEEYIFSSYSLAEPKFENFDILLFKYEGFLKSFETILNHSRASLK